MAAWRQKQWKYKNTTPKLPKKEDWMTGISASRLMQAAGNYIQASSEYVAFNIDGHGGGALGIVTPNTQGALGSSLPILYAHGDFVSDFGFSPHDDCLLATCSFDNRVKLWRFDSSRPHYMPKDPETTLPEFPRRVDALEWNPLVEHMLSVVSGDILRIYDASSSRKLFDYNSCHEDVIQGLSWSLDASLLLTCCKDRMVRMFDPRSNKSQPVANTEAHDLVKDSRVKWVNDNRFITTGFASSRAREVKAFDSRKMAAPLHNVEIDMSNGTLIPLFDADTNMLYLVGKGDNNVRFVESSSKAPFIIEAACDYLAQLKGACLIPKRVVDVMKGEVNRLMLLTKDAVIPVPYIVPRRSYAEFHADVFPDTYSGVPGASVSDWLAGRTPQVVKVSLDPKESRAHRQPVDISNADLSTAPTASSEAKLGYNMNGTPTPSMVTSTASVESSQLIVTQESSQQVLAEFTDTSTWCICNHCKAHPKRQQNICCSTHEAAQHKLLPCTNCILDNPAINELMSCTALELAYNTFLVNHEDIFPSTLSVQDKLRKQRFCAYRNLLIYLYPGLKGRRSFPLPACLYTHVQRSFPPQKGEDDFSDPKFLLYCEKFM